MKRLKHIAMLVAILVLAVLAFWKIKRLPSFSDWLASKPVTIENTPVVVKQIQALAQLVTVSMYEELVVDSNATAAKTIQVPLLPHIQLFNDERTLVIIGKVTTHVGLDLQTVSNQDISGTKDSIHIVLPPAKVLDAIVNPSDVSIFIEKGDWDNDAVVNLKNKIRYLATADAESRGLLYQSEKKAREVLTQFFMAAGYRKVVIQFRGDEVGVN